MFKHSRLLAYSQACEACIKAIGDLKGIKEPAAMIASTKPYKFTLFQPYNSIEILI